MSFCWLIPIIGIPIKFNQSLNNIIKLFSSYFVQLSLTDMHSFLKDMVKYKQPESVNLDPDESNPESNKENVHIGNQFDNLRERTMIYHGSDCKTSLPTRSGQGIENFNWLFIFNIYPDWNHVFIKCV